MPGLDSLNFDFKGIGKLLLDERHAVPKYQRSYSWTDDEVQELWDDLVRAIDESNPDYFLGTVVLSATAVDSDSAAGNLPSVIDGQQRLATVSLLLAALRDVFLAEQRQTRVELLERFILDYDEDTLEQEPRLILNEEDAEFFEKTAIARPNDRKPLQADTPSRKKIARASSLLAALVNDRKQEAGQNWERELVALQTYVRSKAKIVVLVVPDEANAYLIFETLNDRGLDLTIADLLKNYLFGRAGASKIDTVKQNWERALGVLDPGDDDKLRTTFLRHYWSSKEGYTREKELYGAIKKQITTQQQAVSFSRELVEAARLYAAIRNPAHEYWASYQTPTRANLDTLLMLDVTQSRPLLLAIMAKWKSKKGEVSKALAHLVAWTVRLLVVGGAGSGSTEAAFSNAAVKIRKGDIKNAKDLAAEFKPVMPGDSQFQGQFAVTAKKPRLARYLLHSLERKKEGSGSPELISNADETKVNLEHILPRDADKKTWPQFTAEQHASFFNRLGNLALMDAQENGALNAKGFDAKAKIYKKSALKLTKELGNKNKFSDWNPEAIEKRQRQLAALAVETWPLS